MSEANKIAVVAFYKQALMEGGVENAFQNIFDAAANFWTVWLARLPVTDGPSIWEISVKRRYQYACCSAHSFWQPCRRS